MIDEVLPGVFTADHQVAEGKNTILFDKRGAFVIDVGLAPEEGQEIVEFVQAQGFAPNRVILTHGHSDHVLGGERLRGAEVFAHAKTPQTIRRHIQGYANTKGLPFQELLEQALYPTVTFSDELRIETGGWSLHLFPTPGHSPDGVCIYVEEERLLIAGDTVVTAIPPHVGDGDSRLLQGSLHKLRTLEIDILIPGHGRVLRGRERVQEHLDWTIGYIAGLRSAIQDAVRDGRQSIDAMIQAVTPNQLVGSHLDPTNQSISKRHLDLAEQILREELRAAPSAVDSAGSRELITRSGE